MFERYDEATASITDRVAWALCQIIDDDAPICWTQYRYVVNCIACNDKLLSDIAALEKEPKEPTL